MNQKILIYGGTGGIGSALAGMLKAKDYDLHLVAKNEEKLVAMAHELDADYTCGDVNDPDLFTQVSQDCEGSLAGLVYAVGTINLGSLQRLAPNDFINDFNVNALGAVLAIQAAVPALKSSQTSPSVVLFSSVAANQGFPFHASVGMAKAAVEGLTLSLAAELSPKIRVNAIAPSLTQTPLAKSILANEKRAASITALHPLKRLGTPDDIARIVSFLLSPDADWITGQVMSVDGGRSTLRTND